MINRFRVLAPFPQSEDAKAELVDDIYAQIRDREQSDMRRVWQVVDLVTKQGCLCRELARHFADEDSVPREGCGHCNSCLSSADTSKKKIVFLPRKEGNKAATPPFDEVKVKSVLAATTVRDDARFLARVAAEKLGKSEVFGCMAGSDFEGLVRRFERECG